MFKLNVSTLTIDLARLDLAPYRGFACIILAL